MTTINDDLLLRGLILGLSIAAPVGPIGVLCIRRTLSDGQVAGLVSGLGAATADALYGKSWRPVSKIRLGGRHLSLDKYIKFDKQKHTNFESV